MARDGCCAWQGALEQSCCVRLVSLSITQWGQVTHICVSNLTIIGSVNGLLSGQCQAIIWTNDGILLIGPLRTNFSEILIEILTFSFKKMHVKVLSAKRRPFCLSLNVIIRWSCCVIPGLLSCGPALWSPGPWSQLIGACLALYWSGDQ